MNRVIYLLVVVRSLFADSKSSQAQLNKILILLHSDPAGAGVRSLGGLVGAGGPDVRNDGWTASV